MTFFIWAAFIVVILGMLALDLGVFHRRSHVVHAGEAAVWTTVWVILALVFTGVVFLLYEHNVLGIGVSMGHDLSGGDAALQFFTGYVIEKSLSLDNIFVIAVIFSYFSVPVQYQHRVLFWGVLGALVLRGAMIAGGTVLIHRFDWMIYVFGGVLILTAVKMLVSRPEHIEPDKNPLVRLVRRFYPVSPSFDGHRFFTRIDDRKTATPLLVVLAVVESTDVLFAVDSIPAIFAVTRDPFLVFTSNVFAILGLRSLYFVLASVMDRFRYLKMSLVFLLAFVGVKMLLSHAYPIPTFASLAVISGILGVGVFASIIAGARDRAAIPPPPTSDTEEWLAVSVKQVRRIAVVLAGAVVLLVGLAMIVLPGPAIVFIPAGLALLGTELLWARRLLERMRRFALREKSADPPPPQ
jgi:tellurite resistance protein TerC